MPRIPRGSPGAAPLHILNRSNDRSPLFEDPSDYITFIRLLEEAKQRHPVELYAFAVMPNHFHLVCWPRSVTALSRFMQSWMTAHVRLHHAFRKTSGHLWQGRYKSFPVQNDGHLLTVLRYVLLNPVRAGLAFAPVDWPWTSLGYPSLVDPWPMHPGRPLAEWLDEDSAGVEIAELRRSLKRSVPFGDSAWARSV